MYIKRRVRVLSVRLICTHHQIKGGRLQEVCIYMCVALHARRERNKIAPPCPTLFSLRMKAKELLLRISLTHRNRNQRRERVKKVLAARNATEVTRMSVLFSTHWGALENHQNEGPSQRSVRIMCWITFPLAAPSAAGAETS